MCLAKGSCFSQRGSMRIVVELYVQCGKSCLGNICQLFLYLDLCSESSVDVDCSKAFVSYSLFLWVVSDFLRVVTICCVSSISRKFVVFFHWKWKCISWVAEVKAIFDVVVFFCNGLEFNCCQGRWEVSLGQKFCKLFLVLWYFSIWNF